MSAALLAQQIFRIQLRILVACASLPLHLLGSLTLSLVLSLQQLFRRTQIRYAALVNRELHLVRNVILSRVGLSPCKDALSTLRTLVHLECLVLQLRTNPSAQILVLHALVLVEYTYHTAAVVRGQMHQPLHHVLRHHAIVDVGHQIAYTIEYH